MLNRILLSCLLLLTLVHTAIGQVSTQSIRGTVIDKDTQEPLIGVSVSIEKNNNLGVLTDANGKFKIAGVPIGRITIMASYLGYQEYILSEVFLNSAKELVLIVEMTQAIINKDEVVITAIQAKDKPINEMSTVSARTFSVEETQRYASSVNDVGRMAAGFAGVAPAKDNNNDVVVRGNSPVGVLWRLEGIDIPNPNHFARKGSSGGGISIINASLLTNSDFSTGAFAAEYGNSLSSVFDLRFRTGNNERREYTAKAGLLGMEFAAEGPFSKKSMESGSYLVNYRYSTLGILNKMGVYLVGKNVSNNYQDVNFNVYLPTKNGGIFTVFGIAGTSIEERKTEEDTSKWSIRPDYSQYLFNTNMGALGVTWLYRLGNKTTVKTIVLGGASDVTFNEDTVQKSKIASPYSYEHYLNGRYSVNTFINHKFNAKHTFKSGILASNIFYDLQYSLFNRKNRLMENRINGKGNVLLFQPYAQINSKLSDKLTVNAGFHAMYLTFNSTYSAEPRIGIKYSIGPKHSIGAAYGLHSQLQPIGNYFVETYDSLGNRYSPNKNLDLIKANHFVVSYDFLPSENFRIKVEPYLQLIKNLPIGYSAQSTYMTLNQRDSYTIDTLVSKGLGKNKGIDLTVEKFFSGNFYFLISCSWFESKYKTNTNIWYNTRYNMRSTYSLLLGKEFKWNAGVFEIGTRMVYMGGMWYSPVDEVQSAQTGETIRDESNPFSVRMPNYWRADLRLAFKKSKKRIASIIALDVQNLTAHKNVWKQEYDINKKQIVYTYQSSLVPVISYRIDF